MALEAKGCKVHEAETGQLGLQQAAFIRPDVVLLDLGLPDMDGVTVIKRLREWSAVPVLVLSVRDQEDMKVEAFEAGADDYVTKPFGTAELLARLQAIQRRQKTNESPECVVGPLRIDFAHHEATLDGVALKLTPTEYALLKLLARNVGKLITQKQILREVWAGHAGDASHSLRVHVNHLRNKLGDSGIEIRNEPGIGYRLVE